MKKYICDCCGHEFFAELNLVSVRTIIPLPNVSETLSYINKELCEKCAENYHQRVGRALVKVWKDMCHDQETVETV